MFAWLRLAALFVTILSGTAGALAEARVALVVGNGAYRYADKLANPVTDARNMRAALEKLHFSVIFGEDLDKRGLEEAIGDFAAAVKDADVALVYFAGHGATFGDTPYVVPTDARFSSLEKVPYELVPVEELIGELRRAKGVRIAILDACRDDAAERELKRTQARGGEITRGLARVRDPNGLILAYSTQYLATAADGGPDGDSPFTAALLQNIVTPGLDVKDMFFKVAREVIAKTNGQQQPEISVSFYDSYALAGPAPAAPVGPGPDELAWSVMEASATAPQIAALIQKFPSSRLVPVWEKRLAAIHQPAAPVESGPCGGVTLASLETRAAGALSRNEECALKPKDEFRECKDCPAMVVVPKGIFTMGSPAVEPGRYADEGPQHDVTVGRAFAVGKFDVTVDEFKAFVAATGYDAGSSCYIWTGTSWEEKPGHSWRDPGFSQTGSDPVACVNWNDAQAYAAWVKQTTGQDYRLLSEAE